MKFTEFKYQIPTKEHLEEKTNYFVEKLESSSSAKEQIEIMREYFDFCKTVSSAFNIVSIRFTQDTLDKEREKENEIIDEISPHFMNVQSKVNNIIIQSNFLEELKKEFGELYFKIIETDIKLFSKEVMSLMEEENKLASSYSKLRASASIMFDGEEKNLAQMEKYAVSPDRSIRKSAADKVQEFFEANETKFDEIYDQLVKVRTKIAHTLGFPSYTEYKYLQHHRFDYDKNDIHRYREQIKKYILPLSKKLRAAQAKRIGVDKITYYDQSVMFTEGNATPQGDSQWILNNAIDMYHQMSKETGEFIDFMVNSELLDLVARKGKSGGGYCSYIGTYDAPFIFSNFNGTSADVDVLTHEAGHAFMCYAARDIKVPDLVWPSLEACEIHSMSMEFFAYPWIDKFFLEQTDRYKYEHITTGTLFLLYGALVDHFQHEVYANPTATPDERKAIWAKLQDEYLPHIDRSENEFLMKGTFWYKQGHIFSDAFYYIDYTLAQVCAFQYYIWSLEDRKQAFDSYLKLCALGGTQSFLSLVASAGLKSPFDEEVFSKVFGKIEEILYNSEYSK